MKLMKFAFALTITLGMTGAAHSQSPTIIEEFRDWGAYSYQSGQGKVCYVLTPHKTAAPLSEGGRNLDHGQNYMMVVQRVGQTTSYEPQIMMSYNMKANSKVAVTIGNQSYQFKSNGKVAYLESAAQEPALVDAMRAGSSLSIQVQSARNGNARNYSFSLSGVTAALKRISTCD